MTRIRSYNLWPAADGKPGDCVVWASGGWKLTVNLRINGATGEVDRRLVKSVGKMWYREN